MSKKILFFHSPEFFPPLDFFYGLVNSNIWIVLDHVNFTSRSRQSRCRIKTDDGVEQLAVAVKRPQNKPIYMTVIDSSQNWQDKFLRDIKTYYQDTPFFDEYYSEVKRQIKTPNVLLETLTLQTTLWVAEILGKDIVFFRTCELNDARGGRYSPKFPVFNMIPKLIEKFRGVPFNKQFQHHYYPQRNAPFERDMSILDVLFCVGAENANYMLRQG